MHTEKKSAISISGILRILLIVFLFILSTFFPIGKEVNSGGYDFDDNYANLLPYGISVKNFFVSATNKPACLSTFLPLTRNIVLYLGGFGFQPFNVGDVVSGSISLVSALYPQGVKSFSFDYISDDETIAIAYSSTNNEITRLVGPANFGLGLMDHLALNTPTFIDHVDIYTKLTARSRCEQVPGSQTAIRVAGLVMDNLLLVKTNDLQNSQVLQSGITYVNPYT